MAYKENLSQLESDIIKRKEFFALKLSENEDEKISKYMDKNRINFIEQEFNKHKLTIYGHQLFIRNFMNPNTPYSKLFLKWGTGTGKTLGALTVANEFIKFFKFIYHKEKISPSVFIIGFTGENIKQEIFKFPELGIVSHEEIKELQRLEEIAKKGFPLDIRVYRDYYSRIKRRLTNKDYGGFYKFYGYQEFVGKIFNVTDDFDISTLDTKESFELAIKDGNLSINEILLKTMKNSLVICDEIHHVYNASEKNNYGIALQYIFDRVEGLRGLFLSATPINTNPAEVVDVINLLCGTKLNRTDLFIGKNLRPGAEIDIKKYFEGKVSFLQDASSKSYPMRNILGEKIEGIPYLKFFKCPLTDLQLKTFQEASKISDNENILTDVNIHDREALNDIVIPNPDNPKIGLFRKNEIKSKISSAPEKWKQQLGIHLIDTDRGGFTLSGQFLEKQNLKKYSGKYYELLRLAKAEGKSMIYHNAVHASGILLIKEIFLHNHYIDTESNPTDDTICALCGIPMDKHNKKTHDFYPARIVIITGNMLKSAIREVKDAYNSPNNIDGRYIKLLIASKIMREGHDLKCVNNLFILTLPVNIPSLLQVIGRTIRKNSHKALPFERRYVNVHILIGGMLHGVSPEEKLYREKMADYIIIQQIETIMNKSAIDYFINREKIFPKGKKPKKELGALYYENPENVPTEINTTTFRAYGYFQEEMDIIRQLIKELFILTPIWTYDDLWEAVQNPPFSLEVNTKLFSKNNFALAIKMLSENINTQSSKLEQFINSPSVYVQMGNILHKIVNMGDYYILLPDDNGPIMDYNAFLRTPQGRGGVTVNIEKFIGEIKVEQFDDKYAKYLKSLPSVGLYDQMEKVFSVPDVDFYYNIMKKHIDGKLSLPDELIDIFIDLNLLYTYNMLTNELSAEKLKILPVKSKKGPIAYKSLHEFLVKTKTGWESVPRTIPKRLNENNIIGYFDGDVKFKIKKLSEEKFSDGRMVEKGIVCQTQNKKQLETYIEQLNLEPSNRTKKICNQLLNELLSREIIARRHKNQRTKWMYMFNEQVST
ncbi:MAG: DEAD/DEAH box helicase family protein [Candidatus Aenigmarchaeota archaeon]|nr:DEAD/DEAH box helicase family protein [Candidatus Aenigmarchaeota archaeon]